MQSFTVTTPDGLTLAAQSWGKANGDEIVFIHGFNQCHMSWLGQVANPDLAAEFRMVSFDLRGHGSSDKSADKACYAEDRRWADDVAAVIAVAGLKRPVLVGWSYAGRVITDFLRVHGQEGVAGINFVGAVTRSGMEFLGPGRGNIEGMLSGDLAANIAATRGFVRACFARQPTGDDFETMLAFNMLTPPHVRAMILDRTPNPGDLLPKLSMPVLVTHGAEDSIILPTMGRATASAVKNGRLSLYDGCGHAPFMEDAPRFNRELAEFVRSVNG